MLWGIEAGCGGSRWFARWACSTGETAEQPGDAPTYHRDVRPILESVCTRCHVDGGIAPYPLETFAQVQELQHAIATAVVHRTMPPWLAGPDCAEYEGDFSLSDEEIATIDAWVDGGALEGGPADAPEPPEELPPALARVDQSLRIPVAYAPLPVEDDYRYGPVIVPAYRAA